MFVEHHLPEKVVAVYAHVVPLPGRGPGASVAAGEVIGHIADTTGRKNRMPAHLHLTIMTIPDGLPPRRLNWDFICGPGNVALRDPLTVITCPVYERLAGAET